VEGWQDHLQGGSPPDPADPNNLLTLLLY
jgi:hypothetical protein